MCRSHRIAAKEKNLGLAYHSRLARDGRSNGLRNGLLAFCLVRDARIGGIDLGNWRHEREQMDIYVGNLPYSATEEDVTDLFAAFGPVERVKIITDRDSGQSKGFAFVTLGDQSQLNAAIEALNDKDYQGRALRVNASEPRESRPSGGGGYGGGGYGGGGGGGKAPFSSSSSSSSYPSSTNLPLPYPHLWPSILLFLPLVLT